MDHDNDRRSFLQLAIFGIGGVFSAIIGVPIVAYVLDPRHRKAPRSDFKLVDGVRLDEMAPGAAPKQGVVKDTRMDGWTLYPNDVVGRVWVVPVGPRPDLSTPDKVEEFNRRSMAAKERYVIVFTTICPHLGCSVNLNTAGNGFACPCHAATFTLAGAQAAAGNPAKRGMDTLVWEIDVSDPEANRILVKYQNFKTLEAAKEPVG